jgi:hypothetical protein
MPLRADSLMLNLQHSCAAERGLLGTDAIEPR